MFEGEGTITHSAGRPRLVVKMNDREPLERFAALTGGRLYGPYANAAHDGYPRKPSSMVVLERDTARTAFARMRPWLSRYRLARYMEVFGE